ncbi:helix-turn-helix domain-containing protein [Micromonospora sp. NPDC007271]
MKRAYRYRFYPSPEQAGQLSRTFGCACGVQPGVGESRPLQGQEDVNRIV